MKASILLAVRSQGLRNIVGCCAISILFTLQIDCIGVAARGMWLSILVVVTSLHSSLHALISFSVVRFEMLLRLCFSR